MRLSAKEPVEHEDAMSSVAQPKWIVGTAVTRLDKPPSEHGVVTDASGANVVVHWHLKQAESRGRPGLPVGKVYEDPAVLVADNPCNFCKAALAS
jgi:hypothetical protein